MRIWKPEKVLRIPDAPAQGADLLVLKPLPAYLMLCWERERLKVCFTIGEPEGYSEFAFKPAACPVSTPATRPRMAEQQLAAVARKGRRDALALQATRIALKSCRQ